MVKEIIELFKNKTQINACFFGDSVTQGLFANFVNAPGSNYQAVYHNRLKNKINGYFPAHRFNVINAGVGGDNAKAGLARIDKEVLNLNPDFVVVCFGLNDITGAKEDYISNLKEIFTKLNNAKIPTIFMTPNMLNIDTKGNILEMYAEFAKKTMEYQLSGRMDDYMQSAIAAATECGVAVCDCYGKWKALYNAGVNTSWLLANGINHPTEEMHQLFADQLFETIFFD